MTTLPTRAPHPSAETQPFFDAASEGRLSLPVCDDCGWTIWYPRLHCPKCRGEDVTWTDSPGTGTVYSFTVTRRGQGRWRDASPFVIAYVELDEGPRVLTNIVDVDPETVHIGMEVTATFQPSDDEGPPVLRFAPR